MKIKDLSIETNPLTEKEIVGRAAAELVESGMRVGLGTGSTSAFAIEALGRRIREERLEMIGVATSLAAEQLAIKHGVPLGSLDEIERLDLALDGADEVSPSLDLIKGRGGAHTREKVIAVLADRFVVLVDQHKLVPRLGSGMPVPVEVLPMAAAPVARSLTALGGIPVIRTGEGTDDPLATDQGFWIIDAKFEAIEEPAALDRQIKLIPGVLDHGLFIGLATDVLVGEPSGCVRHLRP